MAACTPSSLGVLAAARILVDPADPAVCRGKRVIGPAGHARQPGRNAPKPGRTAGPGRPTGLRPPAAAARRPVVASRMPHRPTRQRTSPTTGRWFRRWLYTASCPYRVWTLRRSPPRDIAKRPPGSFATRVCNRSDHGNPPLELSERTEEILASRDWLPPKKSAS